MPRGTCWKGYEQKGMHKMPNGKMMKNSDMKKK